MNKIKYAHGMNPNSRNGFKKGYKQTKEQLRKLSFKRKGMIRSDEWRKNLSNSLLGNKNGLGRKDSIETRLKKSSSNMGKQHGFKSGMISHLKDQTYEKVYGLDKAKEIKNKLREGRKNVIIPVKDTKIEIKIQNFLTNLGIEFDTHKYINIKHAYQCDIFVPSKKLIIECDGDYWHGNPEKYPAPTERQSKQIEKDKIRTKELKAKKFKIIRLWGKEIDKLNLHEFYSKLENI
jgi:G:T-mismatch repair DNA endonuclease (very short patch repair protein)